MSVREGSLVQRNAQTNKICLSDCRQHGSQSFTNLEKIWEVLTETYRSEP